MILFRMASRKFFLWVGIMLLALSAPGPRARAEFQLKAWPYYRELTLAAPGPEGFAYLVVDETVFNHAARTLTDLRVIGPGQEEIPYLLLIDRSQVTETRYSPAIINRAVAPGQRQEFILDLGRRGELNNQIELLTADRNFRRPVAVYGSDDASSWKLIRQEFYIFDFTGDVHVRDLTLRYPENIFRYLKVELGLEGGKPLEIQDAQVLLRKEEPATEMTYAAAPLEIKENAKLKATELKVDLGYANLPVSKLVFTIAAPEFYRSVEVFRDPEFLQGLGGGTIYRYSIRDYQAEQVTLELPEQSLRTFWVRVLNHDNQPLAIKKVAAKAPRRLVVFRPGQPAAARLYYGAINVPAPVYDLANLYPRVGPQNPVLGKFGPELNNPEYQAPRLSHRNWSWVLWVVLIPVALYLAYLLWRTVKQINAKEGGAN